MRYTPQTRSDLDSVAVTLIPGGCLARLPTEIEKMRRLAAFAPLVALGGAYDKILGGHVFNIPRETLLAHIERVTLTGVPDPVDLNHFTTPDEHVAAMMEQARALVPAGLSGASVLLPCAGNGTVTREALAAGAQCVAIEADAGRAQGAESLGRDNRGQLLATVIEDIANLHPTDLDAYAHDGFDLVLLTPPFVTASSPFASLDLLFHAMRFARTGGAVVAVMPGGLTSRSGVWDRARRTLDGLTTSGVVYREVPSLRLGDAEVPVTVVSLRITTDVRHAAVPR